MAAVRQPAVVIYLFEMVEMVEVVHEAACAAGSADRSRPLIAAARWLRDDDDAAAASPRDRENIAEAFANRFEDERQG